MGGHGRVVPLPATTDLAYGSCDRSHAAAYPRAGTRMVACIINNEGSRADVALSQALHTACSQNKKGAHEHHTLPQSHDAPHTRG